MICKRVYGDCILIVVFFVGPLFVGGVVIASNLFWSACAFCLDPRSVCIVGICAVILWLDSVLDFQGISRPSDAVGIALLTVEVAPSRAFKESVA